MQQVDGPSTWTMCAPHPSRSTAPPPLPAPALAPALSLSPATPFTRNRNRSRNHCHRMRLCPSARRLSIVRPLLFSRCAPVSNGAHVPAPFVPLPDSSAPPTPGTPGNPCTLSGTGSTRLRLFTIPAPLPPSSPPPSPLPPPGSPRALRRPSTLVPIRQDQVPPRSWLPCLLRV